MKVLVIEDDSINRLFLEETIKNLKEDVELVSVASTTEGVFHLFTKTFNLIFLDMMMPALDGHDFLNIVEENIALGNIKNHRNIVVQTAIQADDELSEIAEREVVQQVLRKPLTVDKISDCLEKYS